LRLEDFGHNLMIGSRDVVDYVVQTIGSIEPRIGPSGLHDCQLKPPPGPGGGYRDFRDDSDRALSF